MATRPLADYEREIGERISQADFAGAGLAAIACRAAWPQAATGWLLGSIAALLAGDQPSALALADLCLARHPGEFRALLQRGECLFALGRRADALASAAAAAEAAGKLLPEPAALATVAEFLVRVGEQAGALEIYDRAILAAPGDADLQAKRALVHRYLGNFDRALADHDAVLALRPNDADALKGLADLAHQSGERNQLSALSTALTQVPEHSQEASKLHFALAKTFADLGRHTDSWQHLVAGNRVERSSLSYESSTDCTSIDGIIAAFPAPEAARADTTGESPIFILGLPRTGSTLVERIIGGHSAVYAAGELAALSTAVGAAVERLDGPKPADWLDYAASLGRLEGEFIAREYLAQVRSYRGDRRRFADKQPTNFVYCALIFRAFPAARIIHLTRHPLAACYAIFKTRFAGTYPYAYDLADLAEFYIAYRRLMAHWHTLLPGRILDVAYEDVVQNLEPATRRMLDYLGLPFEAACLEFHRNPRAATTASAIQVRQPLYESSLHQWRHFAAQLAPLRDRLLAAGIEVD